MGRVTHRRHVSSARAGVIAGVAALPLVLGGCALLPFVGGEDGEDTGAAGELRAASADGDELVRRVLPALTDAVPDGRWAGFSSDLVSCGGGGLGAARWSADGDLVAADPSLEALTAALEDVGLEVARDGQELSATSGDVELTVVRVPATGGGEAVGRVAVESGCADPGDEEETDALAAEVADVDYVAELDLPRLSG